MLTIIQRFTTNREYRRYNLIEELEERHLFQKQGTHITNPVAFVQNAEEYIQSIHSRNGFSYERMGQEAAEAFDEEVRTILTPFLQDEQLKLSIVSHIVWGKPQ